MSGSAANSAAIRRRSGVTGTPTQQNTNTKSSNVRRQPPTPIQILENHELRLREIEKKIHEQSVNEQSVNEHSNNESNNKHINELLILVDKLQNFAVEISTSMLKIQAKNEVLEERLNKMVMSNISNVVAESDVVADTDVVADSDIVAETDVVENDNVVAEADVVENDN